jgi:hypothetical protein
VDGRLVMVSVVGAASKQVVVVLNFLAELVLEQRPVSVCSQ